MVSFCVASIFLATRGCRIWKLISYSPHSLLLCLPDYTPAQTAALRLVLLVSSSCRSIFPSLLFTVALHGFIPSDMLHAGFLPEDDPASVGLFIGPWTSSGAVPGSQLPHREALRRRYMMLPDNIPTTSSHGSTIPFDAYTSLTCKTCFLTVSSALISVTPRHFKSFSQWGHQMSHLLVVQRGANLGRTTLSVMMVSR